MTCSRHKPETMATSLKLVTFPLLTLDFASLQFTKKDTKIKIGNLIGQTAFLNAGTITVRPDDDKIVYESPSTQRAKPKL